MLVIDTAGKTLTDKLKQMGIKTVKVCEKVLENRVLSKGNDFRWNREDSAIAQAKLLNENVVEWMVLL